VMAAIKDLKCVVTGSFGFKDIGDEAMLTEDLRFLVDGCGMPRENIVLLGHIPEYVAQYHDHPMDRCLSSKDAVENAECVHLGKPRRNFRPARILRKKKRRQRWNREIDEAVAAADFALVTGGGTINTRAPDGRSLKRMHAVISYFRHHGTPIFMSGQTLGPLGMIDEHDALAREIVETVEVLTVRDACYSKRYLDVISATPKRFLETFDDAYSLPYEHARLAGEVLEFMREGPVFTVCVTDYTSDTFEKKSHIAMIAERLLDTQCRRIVFVSHTPKDLQALYEIYDMLKNSYKERVMVPDDRLWSGSQLKKLISLSQVAIGGRYHFIVFAGSSDTPFVGMAGNHYSYIKQDGFARQLGLEDYVLTERQTWDLDAVLERAHRASGLRPRNRDRFSRPSDSMQLLREWLEETAGKDDVNLPGSRQLSG